MHVLPSNSTLPHSLAARLPRDCVFLSLLRIRQFPLQDGAIVFAAPIGEIDYDPQVTIQVAFGEGQIAEGEPMIPTLNQLVDFTERLINIFAKYT